MRQIKGRGGWRANSVNRRRLKGIRVNRKDVQEKHPLSAGSRPCLLSFCLKLLDRTSGWAESPRSTGSWCANPASYWCIIEPSVWQTVSLWRQLNWLIDLNKKWWKICLPFGSIWCNPQSTKIIHDYTCYYSIGSCVGCVIVDCGPYWIIIIIRVPWADRRGPFRQRTRDLSPSGITITSWDHPPRRRQRQPSLLYSRLPFMVRSFVVQ